MTAETEGHRVPRPYDRQISAEATDGAPRENFWHEKDDSECGGEGAIGWLLLAILVTLTAIAARLIVPMVLDAIDRPSVCTDFPTECAAAVVELQL